MTLSDGQVYCIGPTVPKINKTPSFKVTVPRTILLSNEVRWHVSDPTGVTGVRNLTSTTPIVGSFEGEVNWVPPTLDRDKGPLFCLRVLTRR